MLSEFQPGLCACGLMVKFRATSVEGTVLCSMVLSAGRNDSDWVSFRMPVHLPQAGLCRHLLQSPIAALIVGISGDLLDACAFCHF